VSGRGRPEKVAGLRDLWRRRILAFQSGYYVLTGLWPVVHYPSFEAVTGPKTDDWLVHTVGLLAFVIGAALGVAVARDRIRGPEVVVLAAGAALAFAGIDLWHALPGQIPRIYLTDAAVELSFIAALAWTRRIL
jgi:hypothetical protein